MIWSKAGKLYLFYGIKINKDNLRLINIAIGVFSVLVCWNPNAVDIKNAVNQTTLFHYNNNDKPCAFEIIIKQVELSPNNYGATYDNVF